MFENHIVELEANMYDNYRLEETIALANLARILSRLIATEGQQRMDCHAVWVAVDPDDDFDDRFEEHVAYLTATSDAITIIQEAINKLRYMY